MIIDYRLQNILNELQKDLKEKGIELPINQIEDIVNSQFKAVRLGIEQCDKIVLPFFGTFDIKKRTKFVYNQSKALGIENNLTERMDGAIRKVTFKINAV